MLKEANDLRRPDVDLGTRKRYHVDGVEVRIAPSNNRLKSFLDSRRAFLLERTTPNGVALRVDAPVAENFRSAVNYFAGSIAQSGPDVIDHGLFVPYDQDRFLPN